MPNHVTNELTAPKHIIDSMMGADGQIDFNAILPMPTILRDREPHTGVIEYAKIAMGVINLNTLRATHRHPGESFKSRDYGAAADALAQSNAIRTLTTGPFPKDYNDKDFEDFFACCRGFKETGSFYWYEWATEHWGTKWGAYQTKRVSNTVVKFQTAWSAPIPVIRTLAEKFKGKTISLRWADEDFGCNVGSMSWDTEERGGRLENNTPESHALALELIHDGKVPEHLKLTESGRFEYVDA